MRGTAVASISLVLAAIAGCTLVPSGRDCPPADFPVYFQCYSMKTAMPSAEYDSLLNYGRELSEAVAAHRLASASAFSLFDARRQQTQDALVEQQARAMANATRRHNNQK